MDLQTEEKKPLNIEQRNLFTYCKGSDNILLGPGRPKSSKLTKPSNPREKSQPTTLRGGSPPQEGPSAHDVRQAFQIGLNKISQNQTREIVR